MTLWVCEPPSLCTAVALTWIWALWGVEIKRAQPGCCQKPRKRVTESHLKYCCVHVRLCLKSRRWHLCLHEWRCMRIHASKSPPGCVHLCMWSVFAKWEGFSAFNYSSAKTLHVHSRASQPTDPDTLLRRCSWRKQTREEAWYIHFMGSSTNQLFKYFFLAANHVFFINLVHIKVTLCL